MHPLDKVKAFYKANLKRYGKEDIRGMGWHEEDEYSIRFEVATQNLDLEDASLLDVGCGYGGLYQFLRSNEHRCSYKGIDVLPEMVEIAKQKNPTGKFQVGDVLENAFEEVDYVFCIGSLNIIMPDMDAYVERMLRAMLKIAKKAVILSVLSERAHIAHGPYYFLSPDTVKSWFKNVEVSQDPRLLGETKMVIYR